MEEIKRQLNEEDYLEYIEQWEIENKELIKSGKCKKTFTNNLPKLKTGRLKGTTVWENTIEKLVYFIYGNVKDWITIIGYNKDTKMLTVKYNNVEFDILHCNFIACKFGRKIGEIKYSHEFKYNVGDKIEDRRKLLIIDMENRKDRRWYKYQCIICKNIDWIREDALIEQTQGCNSCSGHKVIFGFNDIPTTAPFMVKYFQYGYDEAKLYTYTGSGNPNNKTGLIKPICPDCKRIRNKSIRIYDIYRNNSIGCSCSDSISFPEKTMFNILEQLKLDFQTQLNKSKFQWCDKYKYDFYFEYNNEQYVCEVHGIQHYEQTNRKNSRTLDEEQENDRVKKQLALANGIKEENYIVVDCRYSELEFIKNNKDGILNSKLNELFDLRMVNWLKCEEFALSNRLKEACDLWNSGIHSSTKIGTRMKIHGATIIRYLKTGRKVNFCDYSKDISIKEVINKMVLSTSKPVICSDNGIIFKSIANCSRKSKELFGINICEQSIANVCNKNLKQIRTKGFMFRYISDLTQEEIKHIQENAKLNQAI